MAKKMNKNKLLEKKWRRGKRATLYFYERKSKWKFRSFNKDFPLHDYFGPMIGDKTEVSIADIGAGMVSTIGSTWKNVKIRLFPSDVLANDFNKILKYKHEKYGQYLKHGYKPLYPVEQQDMENLTYDNDSFDIVHCANALDHCADPFKAVREMFRVCKPEGWVYLRHFENNAKLQHYHGLHQWNISLKDDDCLFENIFGDKFLLSACVNGFKTVKRKELDIEPDDMIISKLQKLIFS